MNAHPLRPVVQAIQKWYIPLVCGILLAGTGVIVLASPLASYLALSILFSLTFLGTGIMQILFSVENRQKIDSWGWLLAGGILYTLMGIMLLVRQDISMATLPYFVGFFILFQSTNALGWAFDLKGLGILQWGNVAIAAVLGILFSVILIWNPVFTGLTLVWWTGLAFLLCGSALIILSLKLKGLKEMPERFRSAMNEKADQLKTEISK